MHQHTDGWAGVVADAIVKNGGYAPRRIDMPVKVLDTSELITAINIAERRGYNRRIRAGIIDKLDDDGIHVVYFSSLTGPDSYLKVRARIGMKFKDDDKPHDGWLDIDLAAFNSYQSANPRPADEESE